MPTDPIRVALLVVDALEALGVPYAIGGSLASSVHGVARATQDVDIVADLQPAHVGPLVRTLRDRFYIDEGAVREAVRRRASRNLIHLEEAYKVDLFVPAACSR
jgi:hypothetical protein